MVVRIGCVFAQQSLSVRCGFDGCACKTLMLSSELLWRVCEERCELASIHKRMMTSQDGVGGWVAWQSPLYPAVPFALGASHVCRRHGQLFGRACLRCAILQACFCYRTGLQ